MDLKEAKYVLAIAKHKSISRAAESLFISQPSLSKYLKNLEQQLGSPLFNRVGSQYLPTYLGERYIHYAEQIAQYGSQWDQEFDDIMHQNHGRLNISIPIMLSNSIIGPVLPPFHKKYPHVNVNLMEEVNFIAEKTVADSSVDLTFYNVREFPKNLAFQELAREEIVLVLSSADPLVQKAVKKPGFSYPWIDLRLLADENFILLYPDQNTGGLALELFRDYDMIPHVLMHTRNSEMSICLAMEGLAAAFAPESYYHFLKGRTPGSSVCLSIGRSRVENILIAAWQKNRYLPQYARDFLNMIATYCKER